MTVRRSRFIRAALDDAFGLLADFSRLPEYNPGVRVERVRHGPCEAGDELVLSVGAGPLRLRVQGDVVAVRDARMTLQWRRPFAAREERYVRGAEGGCVIGWEVEFGVPWWLGGAAADALFFSPAARRNIDTEMDGVQRILEGAG